MFFLFKVPLQKFNHLSQTNTFNLRRNMNFLTTPSFDL